MERALSPEEGEIRNAKHRAILGKKRTFVTTGCTLGLAQPLLESSLVLPSSSPPLPYPEHPTCSRQTKSFAESSEKRKAVRSSG